MVFHYLPQQTSKAVEKQRTNNENNVEWDVSPAQTMCDETRDFQVPIDIEGRKLTMGDLYELTPMEFVSKVMLEEKVFDTWHSGRAVLLGDGKLLSSVLNKLYRHLLPGPLSHSSSVLYVLSIHSLSQASPQRRPR